MSNKSKTVPGIHLSIWQPSFLPVCSRTYTQLPPTRWRCSGWVQWAPLMQWLEHTPQYPCTAPSVVSTWARRRYVPCCQTSGTSTVKQQTNSFLLLTALPVAYQIYFNLVFVVYYTLGIFYNFAMGMSKLCSRFPSNVELLLISLLMAQWQLASMSGNNRLESNHQVL